MEDGSETISPTVRAMIIKKGKEIAEKKQPAINEIPDYQPPQKNLDQKQEIVMAQLSKEAKIRESQTVYKNEHAPLKPKGK